MAFSLLWKREASELELVAQEQLELLEKSGWVMSCLIFQLSFLRFYDPVV